MFCVIMYTYYTNRKTKNGQMKYCVEHKILVSHMHPITTQYTVKSGC